MRSTCVNKLIDAERIKTIDVTEDECYLYIYFMQRKSKWLSNSLLFWHFLIPDHNLLITIKKRHIAGTKDETEWWGELKC